MSIYYGDIKIASKNVTGDTLPVGSIIDYDGATVPENWELYDTANIMTANLASTYTIGTANTPLKLTLSSINSIGSKLTLTSGGIKIGSGITKILVSGQIYYDTNGGNNIKKAMIYKNTTSTLLDSLSYITSNYNTVVIPPALLSVAENDIIYLYCQGSVNDVLGGGASASYTRLTVEVVG